MIATILSVLSAALALYTLLCFVYIIMSWIPGAKFTGFGRLISGICEPYLRIFSGIRFLQIGYVDFSPIVSLGLLSLLSTILGRIQRTGVIYFGGILGDILLSVWNIVESLGGLFFLVLLVRWIVLLFSRGVIPYDSVWSRVDPALANFSDRIAGTFVKKRLSYQTSLLITWISLLVFLAAGSFLVRILYYLCHQIPF